MWGLGGVLALLGFAVFRLSRIAAEAFQTELSPAQWLTLVAMVGFMAYAEGWRGFQRAYSPRVVARALHLRRDPPALHVLLAPLFCMGYFHTTRRRLVSTYLLTAMIIVAIVLFQALAQPWRGILDAGVVAGLLWGLASIVAYAARAWMGTPPSHSPELPAAAQPVRAQAD